MSNVINQPFKVGDFWVNIIDANNGAMNSYTEVTEWFDGTPMDDSKVDGNEYRKLATGEYLRKTASSEIITPCTSDNIEF